MGNLLEVLLPRLFPGLSFQCVPHEGKQDLEKSIPRKLKAWRVPGVFFCVIRDNDSGDCRALKERLIALCKSGGPDDALVRIACQELEAWYLGEPDALAEAFGKEKLRGIGNKARYRDPDAVVGPSAEIRKLVPEFQKVSHGSRMERRGLARDSAQCVQQAGHGYPDPPGLGRSAGMQGHSNSDSRGSRSSRAPCRNRIAFSTPRREGSL